MTDLSLACLGAFWLGIWTSISPCPLATNIAAVSFIGRRVGSPRYVLGTGILYALGRTLAYVGLAVLIVSSVLSMTAASAFLEKYANRLLGPLLVLAGMFLLELLTIPLPSFGVGEGMQKRVESYGILAGGLLGFLFALSFCPLSAVLYFGSLIPMAIQNESSFLVPFAYGIGTALPVLVVAVALSAGTRLLGKAFQKLTVIERWGRWITGIVFVIVGIYFTLVYVFGVLS